MYPGLPEPPPLGTAMLPPGTFAGVTVFVTGGGTGLGRAMAVEFARCGAAVGIASRDAAHRERGVAEVRSVGGEAVGVPCDVRDPEAIRGAFDAVEEALGPVTVLVNNAAANFPVAAADLSPNGWRAVTDIVLDGTFLCSHELHRRCAERQSPGVILNILATQAFTGGPGMAHAAAAKAGVGNLTKSLAVEWGPEGIRVNALAPGLFPHEDMREDLKVLRAQPPHGDGDTATGNDQAAIDARRQPAFRTGRRHELGWAATYLCSPFAAFLTGHTLVVDGGNHLRRDFVMPPVTPIRDQLPPRT
ncbi:short-chain dehydrogenase/reductase SDR [Catenulispora acidiphila DSM 44928]|uniref:Short-chain dehydrogenase/reductase SDR n=1 Tax=Catenulispora acidiphila (strain DSM 44928 / JCM 14897 / NBRC 102108 / NRRL B-24433 / ID139908) TaxID=479433 RepID=C7Q6Q1_CATAD|nr:SDR family oxidoreductase [Catenulispora acidiphila]ACU74086.1 short-chain dehydrogenase/reductase SDR [Catenulispora acidiphila DSM 44928]